MAAQLRHDHIVPVYAVGQYRGLPFCVMEWIAGGSLAQRVADLVTEPREAARLIAAAARALHHAHLHGICHRDVKPANILLRVRHPQPPAVEADPNPALVPPRPRLGDLDACVSDFGLARRTQDEAGLTTWGAGSAWSRCGPGGSAPSAAPGAGAVATRWSRPCSWPSPAASSPACSFGGRR